MNIFYHENTPMISVVDRFSFHLPQITVNISMEPVLLTHEDVPVMSDELIKTRDM